MTKNMTSNNEEYKDILVSKSDAGVLTLTLNRPKSYNALRNNTLQEIVNELTKAERATCNANRNDNIYIFLIFFIYLDT